MKRTMHETELWQRWFNEEDEEAVNELLVLYQPLVHYHVQRISVGLPKKIDDSELHSHGMMGLYDALLKFDTSRDLQFDTYASFRVKGAILDGLRKEDWMPRTMRERSKQIESAFSRLEQACMRSVTTEEVAEELGLPLNDVLDTIAGDMRAHILSIDEAFHDDDQNESFAHVIEDQDQKRPDDNVIEQEIYQDIGQMIQSLNRNEQLVVSLFYNEELTLTEIGRVLDLSTSRISQIHSKALLKLKELMTHELSHRSLN